MKRLFTVVALSVGVLAALAGVLYQFFGLRLVLDGGGTPRVRFVTPVETRTAELEAHRAAQTPAAVAPASDQTAETAGAPAVSAAAAPALQATAPEGAGEALAREALPRPAATSAPWPDFRGPLRDGHYRQTPVLTRWPAGGLTPMWKQPVGGGYASFVIASGRAFTIEQRRDREVVAAYDVESGRELWQNGWPGEFREFMGGDGPRATPTWSDGRVYALGALGEFRVLDEATGRVLWRKNILDDNGATNLQWAMAAAPLLVDDTVIVLPGGRNGRSVVAYDKRTGERVWGALDDKQAYVSPILATLGGRRQLVIVSASRMVGLTPDRGELLWEYPWVTEYDINAAQPIIIGENRVFISSGYGEGAAVIELALDGSTFGVREVWKSNRMKNRFNSSVLHEGYIYGFDEAILACLDAATGELKWKGGRYGYGQLMLADGHLIVLTEDGDLALVRATPTRHEEVTRFHVLDGKTWNHPAMADGRLLIRNLKDMAAFDLRVR